MKMTKDDFLKNIYTRREAEKYLTLDKMAFQHHIKKGNIVPCKEYGDKNAKVQLFWKNDLDILADNHLK